MEEKEIIKKAIEAYERQIEGAEEALAEAKKAFSFDMGTRQYIKADRELQYREGALGALKNAKGALLAVFAKCGWEVEE